MIFLTIADWIKSQNLLETAGVITGILCVYLAAKNKIWNWPFAIISVIIYIFIFWDAKLYADMGLQVYFLVMNFYGWYFWSRKDASQTVPVSSITLREIVLSIFGIVVFTAGLGFFLYKGTDASFPFIDSFCTACSLVAQIFLARKVMENWLIWIFVDIIYVGVYIVKDLHLTAGMYALYIYIAVMGYLEWRRQYRISKSLQVEK
ncbi:nicotinamide riboside transporter PnuC [Daejeonella lutea]|uniref:Nicotinamide riboside transporter PnuC n=1 Tax=Daejeonella lutea TaxID=572036 RepID=A0A1T5DHD1_9SPHI|nr:nicotinamide riboside transporter PnuC [Daejeonella lutea]SKB70883.1 nicotinamide mononucleotide transporter [Daejeonella lutea]